MNILEQAITLAVRAHAGQYDKAGKPYILHPLHLMMQMDSYEEMITAVLHDVVEDSQVTLRDLEAAGFPPSVVEALSLLTHDRETTSYDEYIQAIKGNQLARRVKLADLSHNMAIERLPVPLKKKDLRRLKRYQLAWHMLSDELTDR